MTSNGFLARPAAFCHRRRRLVLLLWIATAFAAVTLNVKADDMPVADTKRLIGDVRAAGTPDLELAIGGAAVDKAETPAGGSSEGIGLLAAAIVLLIAFGSLLAMALPIVT